ncbi:MAG: NAD(P)/FAD-dependent oxidoreductase [Bacteroidetes bacterium]|nr:NAD(P)/FAD-dependent oxidoreductase [Bacteroidota bacterium]
MTKKPLVLVIGGGFAGIEFIKELDEKLFDVLLIDKVNHHQFQPLFYQVATAQIEPSSISFPLRYIHRGKKNVQIRLAEVQSVNLEQKTVHTDIGDFSYDYLIIGIGCKTNFFGNEELGANAFSLKSTIDAISIRNHVLQNFENILSASPKEKESLLNIVIVGGGPTGVELAGAFAEIKRNILPKDYKRIDFSKLRIILIEGSKNTLGNMSELAKTSSKNYLEKLGVELLFETFVKNYDGQTLELSQGENIPTKTVIWAAGVTGNSLKGIPKENIAPGNRIYVDRNNKILSIDKAYALGDIAYMQTELYPKGHPQLANVAINQAKNLAKNLKKLENKQALQDFEYKDLGTMATIGKNKAVVDFKFASFKGFFAWFIWMSLHLMLILGVKNKIIIFIDWAWAYITKDTALQLILSKTKDEKKQ